MVDKLSRQAVMFLAPLLLVCLLFSPSLPAQAEPEMIGGGTRQVALLELFTAVWCPSCLKADMAVEQLYIDNGDDLAIIAYHTGNWTGGGSPDLLDGGNWSGDDPFGISRSNDRFRSYIPEKKDRVYPTVIINGRPETEPLGRLSIDSLAHRYQDHSRAGVGDQGYTLNGTIPSQDGTYFSFDLNARTPETSGRRLALHVTLIEDGIYWWGWNGDGTPSGSTNDIPVHRFVARQILAPVNLADSQLELSYQVEPDPLWEPDRLGYVAYLQDRDTQEVVQAVAYYPDSPRTTDPDTLSGTTFPALIAGLILALVVISMHQKINLSEHDSHRTRRSLSVTLTLLVSALALLTTATMIQAEEPKFSTSGHEPVEPSKDDTVKMTLLITDAENVTEVEMHVCSITDGMCTQPVDMTDTSDQKTTWTATNIATLKSGNQMGYKFEVKLDNGSKYYFPDSSDGYDGYEVVELNGDHYFGFKVKAETKDDDDPAPGLAFTMVGVVLAVQLARSRRR